MMNWTATTPFSGLPLERQPTGRPAERPAWGFAPVAEPVKPAFGFGRAVPVTEVTFRRDTRPLAPVIPLPLPLPQRPSVDEAGWNAAVEALREPPFYRALAQAGAAGEPVSATPVTGRADSGLALELSFRESEPIDIDELDDPDEAVAPEVVEESPAPIVAAEPTPEPEPEREPEVEAEPEVESEVLADAEAEEPEAAADEPEATDEPGDESVPPERRELSFKRPKRSKARRAAPEPVEDEPAADSDAEAEEAEWAAAVVADEPARAAKPSRFGRGPKVKRERRSHGGSRPQKLVGLKVGASQLAAAVVVNDGRPEVVQLARTPFDSGVVVDGEVRDEDALATALKEFFAETKLPRKDVRIGVSSNRIGVRTFDIAGIDDDARFDNAVRFKAHEVLPIAVHESVLDYRIVSERVNANGEVTRRVLLVVAPREQIEPYVAACRKAGIKLSGIDLEAFSLLRAFVEPRPAGAATDEAAIVVVSIGHESSTLVVSGAGVCEFTRVIGWGGAALDGALAKALEITPAEASALKIRLSMVPGAAMEGVDRELAPRALDAVRGELTAFARELVSSLQFYQKQPDSLGIGEIVVTGGTTELPGLGDALHTLVGVPVRMGDPLARVVAHNSAGLASVEGRIGSMSVAIGLGIEDESMRAVNLLPSDMLREERRRPSTMSVLAPVAAVVPLAVLGALFVPAHGKVGDRQQQLAGAQATLAALPQPNGGPAIDASIQGEQARRAAAVADVLSSRMAWDRILRDVSLVVPEDVWLTSLKATAPRPLSSAALAAAPAATTPGQAPSAPTGFTLQGYTYSQPAVAKLLTRLQTVPALARVQLQQSATQTVADKHVVQFTIVADLRQAGGNA